MDYPVAPSTWQEQSDPALAEDREVAWRAFVKQGLSQAELDALREVTLFRGGTRHDSTRSRTPLPAVSGGAFRPRARSSSSIPLLKIGIDPSPETNNKSLVGATGDDVGSERSTSLGNPSGLSSSRISSPVSIASRNRRLRRSAPSASRVRPSSGRRTSHAPIRVRCRRSLPARSLRRPLDISPRVKYVRQPQGTQGRDPRSGRIGDESTARDGEHAREPHSDGRAFASDGAASAPSALGVGPSAFQLSSEAELDAVVRSMARLSNVVQGEGPARHHSGLEQAFGDDDAPEMATGGAARKASRGRSGGGKLSRGSTPSVTRRVPRERQAGALVGPNRADEPPFDVAGRTLPSAGRKAAGRVPASDCFGASDPGRSSAPGNPRRPWPWHRAVDGDTSDTTESILPPAGSAMGASPPVLPRPASIPGPCEGLSFSVVGKASGSQRAPATGVGNSPDAAATKRPPEASRSAKLWGFVEASRQDKAAPGTGVLLPPGSEPQDLSARTDADSATVSSAASLPRCSLMVHSPVPPLPCKIGGRTEDSPSSRGSRSDGASSKTDPGACTEDRGVAFAEDELGSRPPDGGGIVATGENQPRVPLRRPEGVSAGDDQSFAARGSAVQPDFPPVGEGARESDGSTSGGSSPRSPAGGHRVHGDRTATDGPLLSILEVSNDGEGATSTAAASSSASPPAPGVGRQGLGQGGPTRVSRDNLDKRDLVRGAEGRPSRRRASGTDGGVTGAGRSSVSAPSGALATSGERANPASPPRSGERRKPSSSARERGHRRFSAMPDAPSRRPTLAPGGVDWIGGGGQRGVIIGRDSGRSIRVWSRPEREEDEDLIESAEVLAKHHLSARELLAVRCSALPRLGGGAA